MDKALWIARKNYLCTLIKKVSDSHGGDDIEFLREHCREVIANYPDDTIEQAIACYESIGIVKPFVAPPESVEPKKV